MKRVCAWCNADLGEREPLDDLRVTHGICGVCADDDIWTILPPLNVDQDEQQTLAPKETVE